ncbi:MAG: hypothetical protein ACU843_16880 [Gammaproteobacteria bacterium]
MLPQLIIHIGAPKCGSSSIQHFLARNRGVLESRGCIVPDSNLEMKGNFTGEQVWFFQQFKNNIAAGSDLIRQRLLEIVGTEPSVNDVAKKIILSAENLSERHDFHLLFIDLQATFDIRIIFYVRRQDEYLLAAWQQWYVKRRPDFWTWVLRNLAEAKRGDWLADIQPWLEAFGAPAITLRRFGKQYFPEGELLRNFAAAADLDSGELDFDVPSQNEGLSDEAVAFAHAMQDLFESAHDNEFYAMLRAWGGPGARKGPTSSLLNPAQRHALLKHYEHCNAELRKLLIKDPNVPRLLFEAPSQSAGTPVPSRGVDANSVLLMRLVYRAYQEIQALKNTTPIEKSNDNFGQIQSSFGIQQNEVE